MPISKPEKKQETLKMSSRRAKVITRRAPNEANSAREKESKGKHRHTIAGGCHQIPTLFLSLSLAKVRACRQIVASLMINRTLSRGRRLLRGIKLQFVICNSECRLIYSHVREKESNRRERERESEGRTRKRVAFSWRCLMLEILSFNDQFFRYTLLLFFYAFIRDVARLSKSIKLELFFIDNFTLFACEMIFVIA